MSAIRVLIVDDSATMRSMIKASLALDPDIEVVGEAEDPLQARHAIKVLNPDLVTLDVEMPNMNGIDFLEKIMRLRPMPVIMVSTLTKQGAELTLRALEIGAIDCVEKPTAENPHQFRALREKVKMGATARVRPLLDRRNDAASAQSIPDFTSDGRVVGIGASTGGVEALIEIVSRFPKNCPPTVIVQHMPANFTKTFAQRLDRTCAATVVEATDGARLQHGMIYLAPGGNRHLEVVKGTSLTCRLREGERVSGHSPSVDVLFRSIAKSCGRHAVGAILTGMGRDGAEGLLSMRDSGALTFGQNESSCVVYGMPRAAFEIGAVGKQLPLEGIAPAILAKTNSSKTQ